MADIEKTLTPNTQLIFTYFLVRKRFLAAELLYYILEEYLQFVFLGVKTLIISERGKCQYLTNFALTK